jgi:predicted O-methyltransferase YrrM
MQFSDARVADVFAEYEERRTAEGERMRALGSVETQARRDEFLLSVGKEAGFLLHALACARRPARILELGTSYGYSTLFLANAARECGATVISIDLDQSKQAYAREMLEKAGLAAHVEFRCGDAVDLVGADPGPFDFVLLDIWKDIYVACFEAVYPKLADEAVIATDNMIYPEGARPSAQALREAIRAKPDLQTVLLPVAQGIELTVKWSAGSAKL